MIEAETCCHLVTLNKINIHNTSYVLTCESLLLTWICRLLLLLPLAPQPAVGFGLSNNTSPFFPIYYQLSPSSHSQHLKISFYFFSPSFPGSSSSSRPFQFLSEDLFGQPIPLHSLQVTQPTYPLPLYPFPLPQYPVKSSVLFIRLWGK